VVIIHEVTLSTTATYTVGWKSTVLGNYDLAWYISWGIYTYACYNALAYGRTLSAPYTSTYTSITMSKWEWTSTNTIYRSTTRSYTYATKTLIVYLTSTEYGEYKGGYYYFAKTVSNGCYYDSGLWAKFNYILTSTYSTISSLKWTNTNTWYYLTDYQYTATSILIYTLTQTSSYYSSYIESSIIIDYNTITNKNVLISFSTDIQYSTITMILAPSPTYLPKQKCTCIIQLCNKINLILISINIYI
jgi:hypothetical protein